MERLVLACVNSFLLEFLLILQDQSQRDTNVCGYLHQLQNCLALYRGAQNMWNA